MSENVFKFKKFEVHHGKSSMKVGVDAVLLGAWAGRDANFILDIGTGSGVIALMLAQRFPNSRILGIDFDNPSVEEADMNFKLSPWKERLTSENLKFPDDILGKGLNFDLVVSNPPYFRSGVINPGSQRERARHQDSLSIFSLLEFSPLILTPGGSVSLISPIEFCEEALKTGKSNRLQLSRICYIKDSENRAEKRVMMEFIKSNDSSKDPEIDNLTLFKRRDVISEPTEEYRNLCKDFYLKF